MEMEGNFIHGQNNIHREPTDFDLVGHSRGLEVGNFNGMDGRTYHTQGEADAADLAFQQDPTVLKEIFIPNQKN